MVKQVAVARMLAVAVAAVAGVLALTGCQSQAPVENRIDALMKEVVAPAVEKAIEQAATSRTYHQGSLSALEPGYTLEAQGFWCIGPLVKVTVKAEGISGTVTWSAGLTSQQQEQAP